MATGTGNLSIAAQARYAHIERLLLTRTPPPARVVELGSAPGDQIARPADLGYDAVSVDIGASADDWGAGQQGRMSQLLADGGVEDVCWNLEEVPYPLKACSFDAVIMTEVYDHVRDYPVRSLQEVRRILKPGGHLYVTTPNAAYVVNRGRALVGQSVAIPMSDWIGSIPHAREYTFDVIRELMRYAGLAVLSSYSQHFHLDGGSPIRRAVKGGLSRLARVRPTLDPMIIVVARRPLSA